jgi:hypothetical protein
MRIMAWVGLVLVCACNKPATEAASASPTVVVAVPKAAAANPVAAPSVAATPQDTKPSAGGLSWEANKPLLARTPKSSMRAAEYGVEGDSQAELSVFYFGPGQGGEVDANITRWLGQITQPDGSDTAQKQKRSEATSSGIAVTMVEAQGIYGGGMGMPGAPAAEPITDAILLGAIASGPQGPVFFKLVGPGAAIERARPAFKALIDSLRVN